MARPRSPPRRSPCRWATPWRPGGPDRRRARRARKPAAGRVRRARRRCAPPRPRRSPADRATARRAPSPPAPGSVPARSSCGDYRQDGPPVRGRVGCADRDRRDTHAPTRGDHRRGDPHRGRRGRADIGRLDEGALFSTVTLEEPTKTAVATHRSGMPPDRRVRLVVVPGPESSVTEAVVAVPGW